MKTCLILSIVLFFFVTGEVVFAEKNQPMSQPAKLEKNKPPKEDLSSNLNSIKDPFVPQLPLEPKMQSPAVQSNPRNPDERVLPPPSQVVNPTPPPMEVRPPVITISGLVWNTDLPQAIVNNQIVGIGDKINEWTIVSIREGGIEISYLDKRVLVSNQFDK